MRFKAKSYSLSIVLAIHIFHIFFFGGGMGNAVEIHKNWDLDKGLTNILWSISQIGSPLRDCDF